MVVKDNKGVELNIDWATIEGGWAGQLKADLNAYLLATQELNQKLYPWLINKNPW